MKEKRLEELTILITDGKHGDCEGAKNSGYYFVSCKDVHDGIIDYSDARQITEQAFIETNKRTQLQPNDILVTNSGTIGRMALVKKAPETSRTTFQKSVAIVKPNTEIIIPAYLYYCLLNSVTGFINSSNGSAQKNLLLGTMRNFPIRYYEDLDKQQRVVDTIKPYDDLIESNQRQIKLLEEAAQRLYREWFVDLRFPGHENVPVVDGVPEGWKKCILGDLFDVVRGKSYSSAEISGNDGLLMVNLSNIRPFGGYNRQQEKTFSGKYKREQLVNAHDLIMGVTDMTQEKRTVGRVALVPNLHSEAIISMDLIKLNPKNGSTLFFYALLLYGNYSEMVSRFSNGTNVLHLRPEVLNMIDVFLPSKHLQDLFVTRFSVIVDRIDALQDEIAFASEARDRLLPKLMSGEIAV